MEQKNKPLKKIAVLRFSAMGDVAMTVPVLRDFLEQNPSVSILFVSNAFFEPIFKNLHRTQFYKANLKKEHKGIFGLVRLFKELRTQKIDAVADLHDVLRSKFLRLLFQISGIKVVKIDKGRAEKKALTRSKNKLFKPLKTTHERYAETLFRLTKNKKQKTENKEELQASYNPIFSTNDFPEIPDITPPFLAEKKIGIAPFAQHASKQYPLDLMREVVRELSLKYTIQLFGGGAKEKAILEAWENEFDKVESWVGKMTFSEEIDAIAQVDVMISMDSGNGHLAAMNGVKVLTIWGLTHPFAGFAPFGQPAEHWLMPNREDFPAIPTSVYGNNLPKGYENALRSISPKQIIARAEAMLKDVIVKK